MFTRQLLQWNRKNNQREMPWKGIRDPYKIWLSEIILQQTRVDQGLKYYKTISAKYPSIKHLAKANEQELFTLWQGLGYYNRCRNMLYTAKFIVDNYHGVFPHQYQQIRELKGIGDYTAAAIASFAFDLPYAVVDGNVIRVLSRYFSLDQDPQSSAGKKVFASKAAQLLSKKYAAEYNQAIMDLGAEICKPQNPACTDCPLQKNCQAFKHKAIKQFPFKKVKRKVLERAFQFFVLEEGAYFYITKRLEKDIWQDLYTFPSVEMNEEMKKPAYITSFPFQQPIVISQLLTHQRITGHFFIIHTFNRLEIKESSLIKIKKSQIKDYAFPKLMMTFFKNYHYL
ncbi:MAG: A/G-specific adenine glycosylase [Chitinophagaceae bacterium]|nr:A/G-specific adenine glycosylase [Chitinophagaceae bacterium]